MKFSLLIKYALFILIFTTLFGCNNIDDEQLIPQYKLNLNCSKPSYDDSLKSRSGSDEWTNGDILYLVFKDNGTEINGTAIYSNDVWDIKLETPLTSVNGECAIWTTTKKCSYNSATNELKPGIYNGVYYAKSTWSLSPTGDISIAAKLTPTMGRIRFKSATPQTISLWAYGYQRESSALRYYFDVGWDTGFENLEKLSITCNEEINGEYYSQYIYMHGELYSVKIDDYVYRRSISTSGYNKSVSISKGKSYTLVCPTESSHDNWEKEKYHTSYLTISGHTFGSEETLRKDFKFSTKTGVIIRATALWDSNSLGYSSSLECDSDGSWRGNLLYENSFWSGVYSNTNISLQNFWSLEGDSHYFELTGTNITTQNFSITISNF